MSSQPTDAPESDQPEVVDASGEAEETQTNEQSDSQNSSRVSAKEPEFSELSDRGAARNAGSINRFLDVSVQVAAELGKVTIPIGDLLKIGEGSVIELNRSVSEPIDLVAQGVKIASGDVVVIDDCFAIRIKEVENDTGS